MAEPAKVSYAGRIRRYRAGLYLVGSLALSLSAHFQTWGHLVPGVWKGDSGGFFGPGILWQLIAFFAMTYCAVNLGQLKKFALAAIVVFVFFVPYFIVPNSNLAWRNRYNMEYSEYRTAIESGRPYGDQHSEMVDGRRLVYWRWMAWGIDNAIGIMYDPEQRLSRESDADQLAFKDKTHGVLARVETIEPGWYYVTHT